MIGEETLAALQDLVGFIRKDRVKSVKRVQSLPHILDEDNTGNESISMPEIWY